MCEKCRAMEQELMNLARECYSNKGVKLIEGKVPEGLLVKTEKKMHIIANEGVFFFEKGAIFETDNEGVHKHDNYNVYAIPIEDLMSSVIEMLAAYDQAVSVGVISVEMLQEDSLNLLEYISESFGE